MKKHIVKIMMLLAVPALAVVSCDSYDRTEVEDTISVDYNKVTVFVDETVQLVASPSTLQFEWSSVNTSIAEVDANGLVTGIAEGATSVVAKSGDITFSVEVVVQEKVEMTDVTLRCDDEISLPLGKTYTIKVDTAPTGANDIALDDFEWKSDDESIIRVSQAGVIKALAYGTTTVHYRRGHFNCEVDVTVPEPTPFYGDPQVISATEQTVIWFRDYDLGGQDVAFYDTATGSAGNYRSNAGDNSGRVAIEGNGNIGYVVAGEWWIYTVNVEEAGTYKVTILANSGNGAGARGTYSLMYDNGGGLVTTSLESTGKWGAHNGLEEHNQWPHTDIEMTLPAGVHKLKFHVADAAHNLYQMKFNKK